MPRREREKRVRRLLLEFGMEHLERKYISQMSGGEQQRAAIARAVVNEPRILLADEPTGNLDQYNSGIVMEYLKGLNQRGMTVVMVTHDTNLAKYGSRVVRVEDGRIGEEVMK